MRPVPVCFPFAADIDVGGGHPSAMLLIRHLDPSRFRPIIVLHGPEGPAGAWLAAHGADFEQVRLAGYAGGVRRRPLRDAGYLLRRSASLARLLREARVRIVHANDIWMLGTWTAAAKRAGTKLVWHHRSGARYGAIHRLGFSLADQMIAVSSFAAGRRAGHRKCRIIPNPFEIDGRMDRGPCRDRLLRELRVPANTQIVGFFANLNRPVSRRKRPLVFVETVAALRARMPELPVVGALFGSVNETFEAEVERRAAALGVSDSIFCMGFHDPVEPYLRGCDVVVAPAVDEGFGRVPIEAMLLGTPVVASDHGNHSDLIRHGATGLLATADDPAAFAAAALELLRNPERRNAIVERALVEARCRFSARASGDAVMAVYEELLTPSVD
ncbi:MAG: glycosyltransferase family 4 protein [Gammaproteobacteria bacterium]|nr:glycosyltransferase family 4 protein [Gammaproteobacteria bacterium]